MNILKVIYKKRKLLQNSHSSKISLTSPNSVKSTFNRTRTVKKLLPHFLSRRGHCSHSWLLKSSLLFNINEFLKDKAELCNAKGLKGIAIDPLPHRPSQSRRGELCRTRPLREQRAVPAPRSGAASPRAAQSARTARAGRLRARPSRVSEGHRGSPCPRWHPVHLSSSSPDCLPLRRQGEDTAPPAPLRTPRCPLRAVRAAAPPGPPRRRCLPGAPAAAGRPALRPAPRGLPRWEGNAGGGRRAQASPLPGPGHLPAPSPAPVPAHSGPGAACAAGDPAAPAGAPLRSPWFRTVPGRCRLGCGVSRCAHARAVGVPQKSRSAPRGSCSVAPIPKVPSSLPERSRTLPVCPRCTLAPGEVPLGSLGESRTHPPPCPEHAWGPGCAAASVATYQEPAESSRCPAARGRRGRGAARPEGRCCRGGAGWAGRLPPGAAAAPRSRCRPCRALGCGALPVQLLCAAGPALCAVSAEGLICHRFPAPVCWKGTIHGLISWRYGLRCGVSPARCRGN